MLKPAQPAFAEVRTGAISGKWLPAAMQLKAEGVLDPLLGACVRLGNVLVLRTLCREALAKASRQRAPHLLNAALLQMDRVDGSAAAAAAPAWLLPPPRTKRDPTRSTARKSSAFARSWTGRKLWRSTLVEAEHSLPCQVPPADQGRGGRRL